MKISVVTIQDAAPSSHHAVDSIVKAAHRHNIPINVTDLITLDNLDDWVESLGDVVIFRWATAVKNATQRSTVLKAIQAKRILINDIIIDYPHLRWKDWQQEFIATNTDVPTIPTWRFQGIQEWQRAVATGELTWPLIQKPRGGIMGRDVHLLTRPSDLVDQSNLGRYIWQPFIPNNGDYRVILIDGQVVGSLHRQAVPGNIANNIGQGGRGQAVTEESVVESISTIAHQVQQALPLDVIGVDIIKSLTDQKYYFLELNVSPQWMKFEEVTNISVGDKIIDMCQHRYQETGATS